MRAASIVKIIPVTMPNERSSVPVMIPAGKSSNVPRTASNGTDSLTGFTEKYRTSETDIAIIPAIPATSAFINQCKPFTNAETPSMSTYP